MHIFLSYNHHFQLNCLTFFFTIKTMQHAPPPPVCTMARVYWTLLMLITVHVWLVTQARDVNMVSDQSALQTLVLYTHRRLQNYWQNMKKILYG